MIKSLLLSSALLLNPINKVSENPNDYYGVIQVGINNVNSYEFDSCYVGSDSFDTSNKEIKHTLVVNDTFYIPKEYGNIELNGIALNFIVNVDSADAIVRKETELSNTIYYDGSNRINSSISATQHWQIISPTQVKIGLVMYAEDYTFYSINTQYIYSPMYTDLNVDVELIDVSSLIFTIVSLPFTFIQQAFNLTLFPGTPYQFNFANLAMIIIGSVFLIFIIKKIMSIKG